MNGILGAWVFYYSSIFLIVSASSPPSPNFIRSIARSRHAFLVYLRALCLQRFTHVRLVQNFKRHSPSSILIRFFFRSSHSSSSGCDSPQILLLSSIGISVTVFLSGWVTLGAVRHLLSHFRELIKLVNGNRDVMRYWKSNFVAAYTQLEAQPISTICHFKL